MQKIISTFAEIMKRLRSCFVFRSIVLIAFSIFIDIVLAVYYFVIAFYSPLMEWSFGLALWYLILTAAKATIFTLFLKRKSIQKPYIIESVTATFIMFIGVEILALSAVMYFLGTPFALTTTTLFINGTVVATLIFSFSGRKYYKVPFMDGSFYRCKKYLSRIEGLFNLILIFQKLIGFFQWNNASVLKSFFMCGITVFIYSVVLSTMLIRHAYKMRTEFQKTQY